MVFIANWSIPVIFELLFLDVVKGIEGFDCTMVAISLKDASVSLLRNTFVFIHSTHEVMDIAAWFIPGFYEACFIEVVVSYECALLCVNGVIRMVVLVSWSFLYFFAIHHLLGDWSCMICILIGSFLSWLVVWWLGDPFISKCARSKNYCWSCGLVDVIRLIEGISVVFWRLEGPVLALLLLDWWLWLWF